MKAMKTTTTTTRLAVMMKSLLTLIHLILMSWLIHNLKSFQLCPTFQRHNSGYREWKELQTPIVLEHFNYVITSRVHSPSSKMANKLVQLPMN